MLGSSSAAHRAADVGQMSLFGGGDSDLSALGALPPIEEALLRERLEWEKELIGVYISEHPVARALAQSQDVVSHLLGAIGEEHHDQKVTVIGLVTAWRTTVTKKGEPMAFVTLEDVQGAIDVVVFPKTWKQTQALWQRDKIVVVRGKVDAHGRKPSIICDTVTDNLNVVQPAEARPASTPIIYTPSPQETAMLEEPAAEYGPPEPDPDPQFSALPAEAPAPSNAAQNGRAQSATPSSSETPAPKPAVNGQAQPAPRPTNPQPPAPAPRPIAPARASGTHAPLMNGERLPRGAGARRLRLTIQRSGDGRADAKRVGDVHRLLVSFRGPDRFAFYVVGGAKGNYELDFPNDTTLICDELLTRLRSLLGPQSIHLIENP
jgi:DNA polymerase-3 subunit alpha